MVWKPLETRPHNHVSGARGDSGADASHRTVQAWMDSREKTAREGTPEPKNEKSIANRRQNNKQSPFVSRFPRHRSLYEMTEELTIQTVYKDRNSHSSRKTSRSLLLRKERLNSEDRGGICITVQ